MGSCHPTLKNRGSFQQLLSNWASWLGHCNLYFQNFCLAAKCNAWLLRPHFLCLQWSLLSGKYAAYHWLHPTPFGFALNIYSNNILGWKKDFKKSPLSVTLIADSPEVVWARMWCFSNIFLSSLHVIATSYKITVCQRVYWRRQHTSYNLSPLIGFTQTSPALQTHSVSQS